MSKTIKFINKAKLIHGDRYGYSNVEYIKSDIKVIYMLILGLNLYIIQKQIISTLIKVSESIDLNTEKIF